MKVLLLATDAYGGRGGIAHYNRCLAEALAELPEVSRVTILPRATGELIAPVPNKVQQEQRAAGGKLRYVDALRRELRRAHDLVICGHLNLLPLAAAYAIFKRLPLVLQVHGIDAWQQPALLHRVALRTVDAVWSVSGVTRDRMNAWARLPKERYTVIPNTIRLEQYGPGPKRTDLLARYGLARRKVILTLARLDPAERYKGIDEILECMPELATAEPAIVYVIAGSGDDRARFECKAEELGIADRVVFTGQVAEDEKADLLRLADVFAMPGRGEGFGIVYLEAMACGVPVVGSVRDASREALREGELGAIIDPEDPSALVRAILAALSKEPGVPAGLSYFSWSGHRGRVRAAVATLLPGRLRAEVVA